jgi:chromate reductase
MIQIVGISGSLRQQSFNSALLAAAAEVAPAGVEFDIRSLTEVPLFNQDLEPEFPAAVTELKDAIAGAAGLVIATPEYNAGIPGVLKNAIDWISRPMTDQARVLNGKPVALLGATPGGLGTTFAQSAWLPVFRTLRMQLWVENGPFYVSRAFDLFDEAGRLTDADLRSRLEDYIAAFAKTLGSGRI